MLQSREADSAFRKSCARCRRPLSACYCPWLPTFHPRTRVVFLQHPRERRMPVSTCRMAHLALAGSQLHHGVVFDEDPQVTALVAEERTFLLFPGEGAMDPTGLPPDAVANLVVVDGTWTQARKIVERNPRLLGLPRLGLVPERPSNYRIRREPEAHCVSTIEAVVDVLGLLEGDRERYRGALSAFDHMVDWQIACRNGRKSPPRRRLPRIRQQPAAWLPPRELAEAPECLVLIYAEANPPSTESGSRPELLHLLASRPATGDRFHAIVRPRRALRALTPGQLELDEPRLVAGEPLDGALDRFARFLRGGDRIAGWGSFGVDLLRAEAAAVGQGSLPPFFDLRPIAAVPLRGRSGGIEPALALLGGAAPVPWAPGRGGRRIAALERMTAILSSAP